MSRKVNHDGRGALQIRFPFDRRLVDLVKTLPNRRWQASERFWWTPEEDVLAVVELLQPEGFTFDPVTREMYLSRGGQLPLDDDPPRRDGPAMPGLFDEPVEPPVADRHAAAGGRSSDYTVSRLNERVRETLEAAFPVPIWLVGEISGFNKAAHKRHASFKLVEHDDQGSSVSEVNATLFEGTRREIKQALAAAGNPFELEDEIVVRMRVRVELYVPWGSYRVIVDELDVNYTLGEAARRREEIIRRLTEAGLIERNSALPFPRLPLRVALVTSLGSDGYNDVLRTLQESGFAFSVTAHGARVQGRSTEPSVLNALDWFRRRVADFDVVLICRGGGSRTDLAWFDSEALGRAVAEFPLPVVVGIGHEQDQSVLDAVGRRRKTPTAAAGLLVETVAESLERMERDASAILENALTRVREAHQTVVDGARRLALAARSRLERGNAELMHLRVALIRGSRTSLDTASRDLRHRAAAIPRGASVLVGRQHALLDARVRQLQQGARRDVDTAMRRLEQLSAAVGPAGQRRTGLEQERTEARRRRLELVDPRRVVERGYSILRLDEGRVLTEPTDAPAGTPLRAELRGGPLRLTSRGSGDGEQRKEDP